MSSTTQPQVTDHLDPNVTFAKARTGGYLCDWCASENNAGYDFDDSLRYRSATQLITCMECGDTNEVSDDDDD